VAEVGHAPGGIRDLKALGDINDPGDLEVESLEPLGNRVREIGPTEQNGA
jgi:hypothetical protein